MSDTDNKQARSMDKLEAIEVYEHGSAVVPSRDVSLFSVAISLKRIADILDRRASEKE